MISTALRVNGFGINGINEDEIGPVIEEKPPFSVARNHIVNALEEDR